jgi:flavin-binding protein dodecin
LARPFVAVELSRSGAARLLGGRKREAGAAVESLLAQASRISEVSQADVAEACAALGVDSPSRVRKEFKSLYGRYLDHCFEDRNLSTEESAELEHLQRILELSDSDVAGVQDDVAISVYGSAVDEVLEDLRIDLEEAEFLARLREQLHLPASKAERILGDHRFEARERARYRATSADDTFTHRRAPAGDFTGRSTTNIEAAINDALSKATLATPQLHWFEVTQISGYVGDASASQWYVVLQAGLEQDDPHLK